MHLAMTLMVRDEADIVSAMLDHHLAQGIDSIIVTDNGSIDGTTDILRDYEARGAIELRFDPVQRKQQGVVVTQMARDAYTKYGADWVINADADEFFLPLDRSKTLHEVFERMPIALTAFSVPVVNLVGPPAFAGSGLQRLVYRDLRPVDLLQRRGVLAHPTPNAVHIGHESVTVVQGNHFVDLESAGQPEAELMIETLHLPWRSWTQFRNKVEVSGRAYEQNPDLTPSPNHHGMRDYARLNAGILMPYYLLRHPQGEELQQGEADGSFVRESILASALPSPVADVPLPPELLSYDEKVFEYVLDVESRARDDQSRVADTTAALAALTQQKAAVAAELSASRDREAALERKVAANLARMTVLEKDLADFRDRRVIQAIDKISAVLRRKG